MNRPHTVAALAAALLALHAAGAAAQVYKWVDERGVVNYSSQPPADPKSAAKVAVVEDRVSVYSPDASLTRAVEANRQRVVEVALAKPEAWQPAVAMIGGPAPVLPAATDTYLADYPYWVGGGPVWGRPRPLHKVPQVPLRPGAIAGAMVDNGLIPGNTVPLFPPAKPVSSHRWDDPRPTPHGGRASKR